MYSSNLATDSPTFEVNISPSYSPTNGAGTLQQFVHSHGDDLVITHHRTNTKNQHHEYICTNVLTCTPHMSLAEHEAHAVKRILRCFPSLFLGWTAFLTNHVPMALTFYTSTLLQICAPDKPNLWQRRVEDTNRNPQVSS